MEASEQEQPSSESSVPDPTQIPDAELQAYPSIDDAITASESAAKLAPETDVVKAPEDPKEPEKPEPVEDPRTAARFAALSKKEREFQAKQSEYKSKFEAADRYEKAKANAKSDIFTALEELGLTFQEVVDAALQYGKPETAEDRIVRLEKEFQAQKEAVQNQSQQQHEKVINHHRNAVVDYVSQNADKYELTCARKGQALVFEVIEESYKTDGKLMPVEEAAAIVEGHFEREVMEALKLKRFAGLTKSQPPPSLSAITTKPNPGPSNIPPDESHEQALDRAVKLLVSKGHKA